MSPRVLAPLALTVLAACLANSPDDVQGVTDEAPLTFAVGAVDRTLPDVDAIGYEVDLRADDTAGREAFRAMVTGTFVATRDLDALGLDFEGNVVDAVTVDSAPAAYKREGAVMKVTLPRIASGKVFTVGVKYHGVPAKADGADPNDFSAFGGLMVRTKNADQKKIWTSLDWPSKARRWLPLRDHPRDGAMFAIRATFPNRYVVVANGKQVKKTDNADGTRTWAYEALTPMPTYDFHVAAYDDWTVASSRSTRGVPIATYTYASGKSKTTSIYGDLPKALDFYEATFGAYRWPSVSFVQEPIFGGGMEHATVVSMDETLFGDVKEARETAMHELAHHWSGNLVRIGSWNDFWLSEGFTEYLTARFLAANDGPGAESRVYREYLSRTLSADRQNPHPVRPADPEADVLTIFDAISYQKGALVLRQLETLVGRDALTAFLRGWFDRHAFQAVTTADLERELTEKTGVDVSKFFAGFVHGTYHPEVRVTSKAVGSETELTVEQLQTNGPAEGFVFPLEVDVVDATGKKTRVKIDVNARTRTQRVAVASAKSVVVDPEEHLLGTVACDRATPSSCRDGYTCTGAAGASVCAPR